MNNKVPDESNEWSFPEVDVESSTPDAEFSQEIHANIHDLNMKVNQVAEMENNGENPTAVANEAEQTKILFEKKIATVNKLISKLNDTVSIIDKELFEIIQDIIRKTVKKIILKEIKTDPQLLNNMIAELKTVISEQNGVINIYLSETDYQKINSAEQDPVLAVNVLPTLAEGDIVIKCNTTEIRAILSDRIDNLLQAEND
jgi:flagellar biosynthesis/type III secretory pathway protein FliH